jgi:hypothetical protein
MLWGPKILLQAMIFGRILFFRALNWPLAAQANGTLLATASGLCPQSETIATQRFFSVISLALIENSPGPRNSL